MAAGFSGVLLTYVEVMRGTILLQLFIIYYGCQSLDAYIAALLGLGLNYAAYEARSSRRAQAIPVGQLEARVLGLTECRPPAGARRRCGWPGADDE
jgi:polar amino acid transport system substrate-binding protein